MYYGTLEIRVVVFKFLEHGSSADGFCGFFFSRIF